MRAFRHEPATGAAVIIKCAAGLLVVAGLAAIGAGIENPETSAVAANKLRWQQHETTAIAHSQTLHQERQARIEPKPPSTAGIELTSAHAAEVGNEVRPSSLTRSEPAPAKPRNN